MADRRRTPLDIIVMVEDGRVQWANAGTLPIAVTIHDYDVEGIDAADVSGGESLEEDSDGRTYLKYHLSGVAVIAVNVPPGLQLDDSGDGT